MCGYYAQLDHIATTGATERRRRQPGLKKVKKSEGSIEIPSVRQVCFNDDMVFMFFGSTVLLSGIFLYNGIQGLVDPQGGEIILGDLVYSFCVILIVMVLFFCLLSLRVYEVRRAFREGITVTGRVTFVPFRRYSSLHSVYEFEHDGKTYRRRFMCYRYSQRRLLQALPSISVTIDTKWPYHSFIREIYL